MRATRLGLATLVAALTIVAPAAAQTTEPPLVTKSFFFQCKGASQGGAHLQKVQNGTTYTPTWTETKPTASFTSGAGCGTVEIGPLIGSRSVGPSPLVDTIVGGTWDERVKTINVEMHELLLGTPYAGVLQYLPIVVHVAVDGAWLTGADGVEIDLPVTPSSTGLSHGGKFGISFKNTLPFAEAGREIKVGIQGYLDASYAFVWGASEVPAGVEFNPGGGLATKVAKPTVSVVN